MVSKEMKPIAKSDYDKLMVQTIGQLYKWKKGREKEGRVEEGKFPAIDELVNWEVFEEDGRSSDLFKMDKEVEINVREFICLVLFYRLYLCISEIY
jgi:hypothetical protein